MRLERFSLNTHEFVHFGEGGRIQAQVRRRDRIGMFHLVHLAPVSFLISSSIGHSCAHDTYGSTSRHCLPALVVLATPSGYEKPT